MSKKGIGALCFLALFFMAANTDASSGGYYDGYGYSYGGYALGDIIAAELHQRSILEEQVRTDNAILDSWVNKLEHERYIRNSGALANLREYSHNYPRVGGYDSGRDKCGKKNDDRQKCYPRYSSSSSLGDEIGRELHVRALEQKSVRQANRYIDSQTGSYYASSRAPLYGGFSWGSDSSGY